MAKRRSQRKSQRRSQHTKSDSGPRAPKTANTAPLSDEAIEQAKRNTLDIDDKLDEPETDSDEEDLEEDAQYTWKLQLSLASPGRNIDLQMATLRRPSLFLNRPRQPSTRKPSTGLAGDPTKFPSSPTGRVSNDRQGERVVIEDSPTLQSPINATCMRALHSCILYHPSGHSGLVKAMDAFLRDSTMTDPNVVLSGEPHRWSDVTAPNQVDSEWRVLNIADLPNDSYDHISICIIDLDSQFLSWTVVSNWLRARTVGFVCRVATLGTESSSSGVDHCINMVSLLYPHHHDDIAMPGERKLRGSTAVLYE